MIINIPIQINEEEMTHVIEKDYENKVINEIVKYIKNVLINKSRIRYGDQELSGMAAVIEDQVEKYISEYKEQIIEIAGKYLADKLAKTKAGKALLEEVKNDII